MHVIADAVVWKENGVFGMQDDREEGKSMYKDVWKKFGVKVLIVLCSVMLLGGVAVVAPKISANESDGVSEETGMPPEDGQDGAAALPDSESQTVSDDTQPGEEPGDNMDQTTAGDDTNTDDEISPDEEEPDGLEGAGTFNAAGREEGGETTEPEDRPDADDNTMKPAGDQAADEEQNDPADGGEDPAGADNSVAPRANTNGYFLSLNGNLNGSEYDQTQDVCENGIEYSGYKREQQPLYLYQKDSNNKCKLLDNTDFISKEVTGDEINIGTVTYAYKGGTLDGETVSYNINPAEVKQITLNNALFMIEGTSQNYTLDAEADKKIIGQIVLQSGGTFPNIDTMVKDRNTDPNNASAKKTYTIEYDGSKRQSNQYNGKITWHCFTKTGSTGPFEQNFTYNVNKRFNTSTVRIEYDPTTYDGNENQLPNNIKVYEKDSSDGDEIGSTDYVNVNSSDPLKPKTKIIANSGMGFVGEIENYEFVIQPKSIAKADNKLDTTSFDITTAFKQYLGNNASKLDFDDPGLNGSCHLPDVGLTWKISPTKTKTLIANQDFAINFNRDSAGCGKIVMTITGMGCFTGRVTDQTYYVTKDLKKHGEVYVDDNVLLSHVYELEYNPEPNPDILKAMKFKVCDKELGLDKGKLTAGTDYEIKYLDENKNEVTNPKMDVIQNKTYTIKITGKEPYMGELSKAYQVVPYDVTADTHKWKLTLDQDTFTFSGSNTTEKAIKDAMSIQWPDPDTADDGGFNDVPENYIKDSYTIQWLKEGETEPSNTLDSEGKWKIQVIFHGNYTGTIEYDITVESRDIGKICKFQGFKDDYQDYLIYNGTNKILKNNSSDKNKLKVYNTETNQFLDYDDFIIDEAEDRHGENKNVDGDNFFWIKGNPKKGYTGELKCTLEIRPLPLTVEDPSSPGTDIPNPDITFPSTDTDGNVLVDFKGESVNPEFPISYKGQELSIVDGDYDFTKNPTAAGSIAFGQKGYPSFAQETDDTSEKYTGTIAGRGNFTGSYEISLKYKKKILKPNDETDGIVINGQPDKLTLEQLGVELEDFADEGKLKTAVEEYLNNHISIKYMENTDLINSKIPVSNKYDYKINKDNSNITVKNGKVTVIINFGYRFGGTKKFTFSVGDDITLTDIYYGNQRCKVDQGDGGIAFSDLRSTVEFIYSPKPGEMYVPVAATREEKKISLYHKDRYLTGVKKGASGAETADFTYRYVNADPGTDAVEGLTYLEIEGTGRGYFGTVRIYYTIKPRPMNTQNGIVIEITDTSMVYTGFPLVLSPGAIKVYDQGVNPRAEIMPEDYRLEYQNNVNAGQAWVKVYGQRNYTSEGVVEANIARKSFTIEPCDIAVAAQKPQIMIVINNDEKLYYTGNAQKPPVKIYEMDPDTGSFTKELVEDVDYSLVYDENSNAGEHKLIIKGKKNYKGTYECAYTIHKVSLDNVEMIRVLIDGVVEKTFAYDGLYHWPGGIPAGADKNLSAACSLQVEYKIGEKEDGTPIYKSINPDEYDVTVTDNRDIGKAVLKIKAKGTQNFLGELETNFYIKGSFDKKNEIKTENDRGIIAYLEIGGGIAYDEKEGKYKVPYQGGEEVKPGFVFKYHWKRTGDGKETIETLQEGRDYELIYDNNTEIGTASVTIRGIGRFTDEQVIVYDITADLSGSELKCIWRNPDKPYGIYRDGDWVIPDIIVKYRDQELIQGEQFKFVNMTNNEVTPKNGPQASIKIVANTPYVTGEKIFNFWIFADMQDMDISIPAKSYMYMAEEIQPEVTVAMTTSGGAVTLKRGTHFKVSYENNVNAGKGLITITGVEEYGFCGSKTLEFEIERRILEQVTVEINIIHAKDIVYTGEKVLPDRSNLIIKCHYQTEDGKDRTITLGEADYNMDSQNSINAKEGNDADIYAGPYLIIHGAGNFRGTVNKAFTIHPRPITDSDVKVEGLKDKYGYWNGDPVKPEFTMKYKEMVMTGKAVPDQLVSDAYYQNCDYSYEYESNTEPTEEGRITITGRGNFTGTRVEKFAIVKKDITEEDVTELLTPEKFAYTGEPCVPDVKLNFRRVNVIERMLNPKITFLNNVGVSTEETPKDKRAQVVIEASKDDPHYEGTRIIYFDITRRSLTSSTKCYYLVNADDDKGESKEVDISTYHFDFIDTETSVHPDKNRMKLYCVWNQNGTAKQRLLTEGEDFTIEYFSEEDNGETVPQSYAGRVKAVITGINNYCDTDEFFYFIGDDISTATCTIAPSTAVFNGMAQPPRESVSGVSLDKCNVVWYKGSVGKSNIVKRKQIIDASEYIVQIEGVPSMGTYAKEPRKMTYTITPRELTKQAVVDGFKREYQYTGAQICPVGIAVTDYIDGVKYKLAEGAEYTLSYANNINIGTATITVNGTGNFKGTAKGQFLITASTISGGDTLPGNSYLEGTGQISGSKPVGPSDVKLTMDTANAMYYTGKALYPRVTISGMTENVDYTVTYSSNTEVGIGVINIAGIGNNTGMITKYFRIIASLSKCTIGAIPTQEYTGSPVTPAVVVRCGNTILKAGTDYTVSYINNVNIGTATVMIRSAGNENYTGSTTTTFKIGNDMSSFLVTGYAPNVVYTGEALTPGVIVESGNTVLTEGTDYTVSYRNNVDVGIADIIVTGIGKYDGTQTVNFVIEARNIESCDVSDVEDKTYTGNAYTPSITVSDSGTVLTNGVDYTVTYKNNTNPGIATIVIEPVNKNYAGTKTINFRIAGVAVEGVKASSIKHSSMSLSWARQSYASGYQICNAQSRVVETVTSNKNSAKLKGLSGGTTYKYKVRSYIQNKDGSRSYGEFSSLISATTKLKTPSVKLSAKKAGQARVEWKAVSGASGYEVYYKGSKNGSFRKVKSINKANVRVCNIKGLKKNQKCYVRVRAFKRQGSNKIYSAKSKAKNVKIK